MKIERGQRLPLGWGYAWTNYESETREAYLIPFNFIFKYLRLIWFFLARMRKNKYDEAFLKGYEEGRRKYKWKRKN